MATVHFKLMTTRGDRLGHLIRGVQMLRSYGAEAEVTRCTDVVHIPRDTGTPALGCVLEARSDATAEALKGICRETEWALGDDPEVLTVRFERFDQATPAISHSHPGAVDGAAIFMHRTEFAQLYDWGQQTLDSDGGLMGEWPSATGG
ncbi:MAG TPA: hypothetical protein VGK74_16350 [Symbiobacteriaceae bacterium]|jgi:hypothetical protein